MARRLNVKRTAALYDHHCSDLPYLIDLERSLSRFSGVSSRDLLLAVLLIIGRFDQYWVGLPTRESPLQVRASDVTLVLKFLTLKWPDGLTFLYGLGREARQRDRRVAAGPSQVVW